MKQVLLALFASATIASAQTWCWTEFTPQGGNYAGAYGAAVDTNSGTIYISALTSGRLTSFSPDGTPTLLGALVPSPVELSVNPVTHNLYVGSIGGAGGGGVYKVVSPYEAENVTQIDSGYLCFATAVDSASETVYAANTSGHKIRIIPNGGAGSDLAGSGTAGFLNGLRQFARFNSPCGLAVVVSPGNTNIYVADRDNNRIRLINIASNTVTTFAGSGAESCVDGTGTAASFWAPTGCTLGPDGNLYIADQDNLTIRKITLSGAEVTTIGSICGLGFGNYGLENGCGGDARFSNIGQVGVASDLTLYVADRSNGDVRKGELIGGPPTQPNITSISFQTVVGTNYCWTNIAGPGGAFDGAYGAAVDSDGTIFVSALDTNVLSKITPDGVSTTLEAIVASPVEISVSTTTHNLYVGSLSAGPNKVVPPYGSADVTPIDGNYNCFAAAVDSASETVYAANTGGHVIRIIPNGEDGTVLAGSGTAGFLDNTTLLTAQFNAPCGIAVVVSGGNTNLYVADRENNRIRKVDVGNNSVTTLAGGGLPCADGAGSAAGFLHPTGVTLGPDGNLYVADQDNFVVRKVTLPTGVVTTLGGLCGTSGSADGCGAEARFGLLGQIGVSSDLTLYAADRSGRVSKGTAPPSSTLVQIDFTAGAIDGPGQFTLQSSIAIEGAFNDVSANIIALGGGAFQALIAPNGDTQFYRIKR